MSYYVNVKNERQDRRNLRRLNLENQRSHLYEVDTLCYNQGNLTFYFDDGPIAPEKYGNLIVRLFFQ